MGAQRRITGGLVVALVVVGVSGCGDGAPDPAPRSSATARPAEATPAPSEDATSPCLRVDGNCLGTLVPGDFASTQFAAFGSPGTDQFTYSVTDSTWANALDHAAGYWFQGADAYDGSNGDAVLEGVYLFSDAAASKQAYPECAEESDPSVPTDAASLIRWVRGLPDLETEPVESLVTASGSAPGIRIRATPGVFGACYDGATVRTFVASRPGAADPYVWGITATEAIEAHFLDLGAGHTVAILFYAPGGTLRPEFVRRARQLAASFAFHDPGR